MWFADNKHILVMQFLSLITRSYNQQGKSNFYLDATVRKINETAIEGFKDLNIHELNTCNFSS